MSKESGRRSILIVEDNELNREMLCAMLEDRYHVFQAENGKEGLKSSKSIIAIFQSSFLTCRCQL